jgi:hypothetical protein
MAFKLPYPVQGRFCGATATPYEFADRTSGEMRRGTTRRLYVSQGDDQAPVEIRLRDDAEGEQVYAQAVEAAFGAPVNLLCEVRDGDRGSYLQLIEVHAIGAPKARG